MKHLGFIIALVALLGWSTDGLAVPVIVAGAATADAGGGGTWVAKKKKKKRKKRKRRKKRRTKEQQEASDAADSLFDSSAPGGAAPAPDAQPSPTDEPAAGEAPVLDLSGAAEETDAARQELLLGPQEEPEKGKKGKKGKKKDEFDFGGGLELDLGGEESFDFGLEEFDVGFEVASAERERFDTALDMMSDEDFEAAALEFRFFLEDPTYAEFRPESQYQLAKALYKLGFLEPSLKRFKEILDQGPSHRRYRKSVEWLFFISRKMADETPVLAELARFRNVTFPKAYRNEYRYLLSKYLFIQAERFEVERMQEQQLARGKQSKSSQFDFSALGEQLEEGSLDFSEGGLDFGGGGEGGGFDFGGGGGGEGGGFDFGGGGGGGEGGGIDFGGGGAMDFGGGKPAPGAIDEDAPVREELPTTAEEAIRQGLALITEVKEGSKWYPRAKYLEGLLSYLGGEDQDAVNAFQEVVRVLDPRKASNLDPKLREMAFLSLARIHYGYQQFNRSAYYYDMIDRDSENWLTALFEASWAYYQRGDFEKALGNLLTLHSPFFEREYYPESQIVKAIIYFEACRYSETRAIVDDFLKRFGRVRKEIQRIAQSQEAPEVLYDRIAQLQAAAEAASDEDDVTARIVSLALNDPQVRTARGVVVQLDEQLALWAEQPPDFKDSRIGRETYDELKTSAAENAKNAGEVTRKKFEREFYALNDLLAQALRIKLEVARSEREAIAARLRGEETTDTVIPAEPRTVVGDEHLYWPYEGEYWRDELGTYELDFSRCRPLASR
jgi:outer membrane protein assembly factor BamD (BamD/ComL family)